jgi:hypothetical protein
MLKFALSQLGNDQLYTFGGRIKNLLVNFDAQALGILFFVTLFLEKFVIFEISYEKENAEAALVAKKDAIRDNNYVALRSHIKNFKRHDSAEKRAISRKLLQILNKDGNQIYRERHSIESASLISIIKEIDAKHLADLELLVANEWYEMMKAAQIDFEKTVTEVNEASADQSLIESATTSRVELEEAIRKLFKFIPMRQEETKSPELADMIRIIQKECDRF